MSANTMYAERNSAAFKENGCSCNPLSRHIIDADCKREAGIFRLFSLPRELPELCTVRFTAPDAYASGDKIVVDGRQLAVVMQNMTAAGAGAFEEGAVVQADLDLKRDLAFLGGGGASLAGSSPDMSYNEQPAGFRDLNGNTVYVRTIDLGLIDRNYNIDVPHGIADIKDVVRANFRVYNKNIRSIFFDSYWVAATNHLRFKVDGDNVQVYSVGFAGGACGTDNWGEATLYYTCNNR